uniref:Potassium channel domain-containing protein n=1 Tax=Strigamia maritima TaxID=126957 RepID=T1JH43_STRMM
MNNISKLQWILSFKTKMCGYHDRLCFANIWMDEVINDDAAWSVLRAVYYCGTVFTATGYGNIVTTTQAGQMLTVIYAVIGVPYTLTVLLDIGSILTSGLRRAYIEIYKMYYLGCCFWRGAIPSHLKSSNNSVLPTHFTTASTSTYSSDFDEPNDKLYLVTGLKKSDFVIPVWVGFFLIVLYAFLGAWLFFYCESWTYFQSLYFIVASLTTIGFGDFVPKHTSYPLAFLYIMIGLAFVSLFFNLVVERVSKAMHKARRKIKGRLRKENKNLNNLNTLNTGTGSIHLSEEDTSFHQSIITVQLLDSLKNLNRRSSNPQIKTAPVVLLKISDTNLLKYVKYEKVKGKRLPVGYITDRHFMKYLRDKISMDVKKKDSY